MSPFHAPCNPIEVPVDADGDRVPLQLQASIGPLYTAIENLPNVSMSNWQASVNIDPANSGLELWSSSIGGTALTPAGFNQLIASGNYSGTVWVSTATGEDPNLTLTFVCSSLLAQVGEAANVQSAGVWGNDGNWARDPNWTTASKTPEYSGSATATGNCSLKRLAFLITGHEDDWVKLGYNGPYVNNDKVAAIVPNGTHVQIGPLLERLDQYLRTGVCDAALDSKKNASFPAGTKTEFRHKGLGVTAKMLDRIFGPPLPPGTPLDCFDCESMMYVVFARGLMTTMQDGEYQKMETFLAATAGINMDANKVVSNFTTVQRVAFDQIRAGDRVYLPNRWDYLNVHQNATSRPFNGENAFMTRTDLTGNARFNAWGDDDWHTYQQWRQILCNAYNQNLDAGSQPIALNGANGAFGVPDISKDGYDPGNGKNNYRAADKLVPVRFFDAAKVASMLFKFRKVAN